MEKKLFSKLDWFSGVFKNCSVSEIASEFSIALDFDFAELVSNQYLSNTSASGQGADVVLELLPGVSLRFPAYQYAIAFQCPLEKDEICAIDPFNLIDYHFPTICFSASGQGLDYLRELGYNVDENLRKYFPGIIKPGENSFHVTRCDFAFDFINWDDQWMFKMADFLNEYSPYGERVFCGQNRSPITISKRYTDKERTIYFGSTGSDKILRCYDKLLQFKRDLVNNVPIEYQDYNEATGTYTMPESWIRIELQTRREVADSLITGIDPNALTKVDFEFWEKRYWVGVLRWIYDYYAPKTAYEEPSIACWNDLFEWGTIDRVIQNAKYVSVCTPLQKADRFLRRNVKSIIRYCSEYGVASFMQFIIDAFSELQDSDHDRWRLFSNSLFNQKSPGFPCQPSHLVRSRDGKFVFDDASVISFSMDFIK